MLLSLTGDLGDNSSGRDLFEIRDMKVIDQLNLSCVFGQQLMLSNAT